nr:ustiloxin b cluster transcription factor ustr [Quercus suber]
MTGSADAVEQPPSSRSCWTCKVRRKRCDGRSPTCSSCAGLQIACHRGEVRPEWMDGGLRQEEMAVWFKCKIKENSHRRRTVNHSASRARQFEPSAGKFMVLPQRFSSASAASPRHGRAQELAGNHVGDEANDSAATRPPSHRPNNCSLMHDHGVSRAEFGWSETILITFYLENLSQFLYPLYKPSVVRGGKAWMLELMISSPVVRQATLCQSSYYLSLAQGISNNDEAWEKVLGQTSKAFDTLRLSLRRIDNHSITDHPHGAARILASIIQLQRFEVAVMSHNNCQAHLDASVTLFRQLLDNCLASSTNFTCPSSRFDDVVNRLGPSPTVQAGDGVHMQSAEQAAFQFSSAILLLDDLIASTLLSRRPKLFEYHNGLLGNFDGCEPTIDLRDTVGCQNWVLLQIGETATLNDWKQQCKRSGNLDVMQLVHRAMTIKTRLEAGLVGFDDSLETVTQSDGDFLSMLRAGSGKQYSTATNYISLVTRIWAHAAILYLSLVVSGWQPANSDVQHHVTEVAKLLRNQALSPVLQRTVLWPYCVAGCLADASQEKDFRQIVQTLQPSNLFSTQHKALELMESVWRSRGIVDGADRDLATIFREHGGLILLV